MTNSSIDLSRNCDPSTIDCLTEIGNQAKKLNMDFFVVGALVRILILEQYYNIPIGVATLDIDIGIIVLDWNHYERLRSALINAKIFYEPDPKGISSPVAQRSISGAPRFGVGPSWMKDYQGFRLKIGTYFGLKTMFLGAKRAV